VIRRPAPAPCVSCPYRRDVPSGIWDPEEYEKLPHYDGETHEQPHGVFLCHQQDGRVCAGWASCHAMDESLALRLAASAGLIDEDEFDATIDYETDVPLFDSGAEAAEHGLAEVERPGERAVKLVTKLARRQS